MQHKKLIFMLVTIGTLLVITTGVWLASAQPASAQCGSSASSCKNCHEVQGQDPVNKDGTGWHQSHAFGDFCYLCHAGNNQATDKVAAHTGMVDPLSDIQAACAQCHASDLEARAQVYASILGVEVGSGTAPASGTATSEPAAGTAEPAASVPVTTVLNVDDANLVDYAQRYDEIVLGKHPVNWGNVILIAMILMLAIGGGGFVLYNEKLVKVSFGDTKKVEGEYPADVVDMLPVIAKLDPKMRKSLKSLLEDPKKAKKTFDLIDTVYSDKE
jgi:cytochrome c553